MFYILECRTKKEKEKKNFLDNGRDVKLAFLDHSTYTKTTLIKRHQQGVGLVNQLQLVSSNNNKVIDFLS